MPRIARKKSESKIYHIMIRGIDQQNIFHDEADYEKFIAILSKYQKMAYYDLFAYCLMGNHVHILIREGKEALSNSIKRIGVSYVSWYNWQYQRKGPLFQGRYKSEPVEDDSYFLTVLRYIHQNPLKAGLTEDITDYPWSSYIEYLNPPKIVNIEYTLQMFDSNKHQAIERFKKFNQETNHDQCLEVAKTIATLSDKVIRQLVAKNFLIELATLKNNDTVTRDKVLKFLKRLDGCSLRQVSRLTGISVYKIFKL